MLISPPPPICLQEAYLHLSSLSMPHLLPPGPPSMPGRCSPRASAWTGSPRCLRCCAAEAREAVVWRLGTSPALLLFLIPLRGPLIEPVHPDPHSLCLVSGLEAGIPWWQTLAPPPTCDVPKHICGSL